MLFSVSVLTTGLPAVGCVGGDGADGCDVTGTVEWSCGESCDEVTGV